MTMPEDQAADETHDVQHDQHLSDSVPLRTALEAILMVVDEPVGDVTLAQVTERPTDEVAAALRGLAAEYDEQNRGFQLREVAGGWRFYTRASASAYVEKFVLDGQQARLTQAALETFDTPLDMTEVSRTFGVTPTTIDELLGSLPLASRGR